MKLKQLFCKHKKLTAVGIYQNIINTYPDKITKRVDVYTYVVCKCDRCSKEIKYLGRELQDLRNSHKKDINIDKVFDHKLWGMWW